MHYQAPHARGSGGFVVLPIKPKKRPSPTPVEPRTAGWLTNLFANARTAK